MIFKARVEKANRISKASNRAFSEFIDVRAKYMEVKFENNKIIGDHIRDILNEIDKPKNASHDQMARLSLIVDPGACDNVFDPRELPGHPPLETAASKQGSTFFTAFGDPIPNLGKKEAAVHIHGGALRIFIIQRTTVSKPLLPVKKITEAGQFAGFCGKGGFLMDLEVGHVEWFREGNANYMLDTWLIPHEKNEGMTKVTSNQGFLGPSK